MTTQRELVVPLDQIRGIRYHCPICRRELTMSLDAVRTFYIWGDVARFCADCAQEKGLHTWLEEKTTVLSTLARMLAGREGVLKEMDLSLIVDVV